MLLVALPVFLVAGWSLTGWVLATILYCAIHGLNLVLARARPRAGSLAGSGVQAFGLFFKAIGLLVVLLAAAATDPKLAVAAVVTYALAYTLQLGLSLIAYFGEAPR